MVTKFLVFGSSNSGDIFFSKANPNYKQFFELCGESQKSSIISLMQNPVNFDENKVKVIENNVVNNFRTKNAREDLNKNFLKKLKDNDVDYLLIDNHFEIDAGILELEDGTLITNNQDIQATLLYEELKKKKIITMETDSEEYLKLYKKNCDLFFKFLKENCPNVKVILNVTRWISIILNESDNINLYDSFIQHSEKYDKYKRILDEYICNNFDVDILSFNNEFISLEDQWGSFHTEHDELSYINDKTNQLNEIIQRNELENKYPEFISVNKKIRLLSRTNFLLDDKNHELISTEENNKKIIDKLNESKFNQDNMIFFDKSIYSNKNKDWISSDNILAETSNEGTKVYSNTPQEGFYYINQELNADLDYILSFRWIGGNAISPIIQIRETCDMEALTTFQKNNHDMWQICNNAHRTKTEPLVDFIGSKTFITQKIHQNDEIKLIKKGNNIKVYSENVLVIDYPVKFHSNFYLGFGGHSQDNRYTIFKDIVLKELNDPEQSFNETKNFKKEINLLKDELSNLKKDIVKKDKFINETPELSRTGEGRATADGKIIYRNWWIGHKKEYDGFLDELWFSQFIQHRFPNEEYKLNFFSIWNNPYKLKQDVGGKKIFYTAEDLNVIHQDINKIYGSHALEYVDLAMGYDCIDHPKYLRFPYWITRTVYPKQSPEEIERSFKGWNSLKCEKTKNVAVINSHDNWKTRSLIANDIIQYTEIAYAGAWNKNTNELFDKYNNDKLEYLKQFKFNICAENVVDNGYVTEKIFDAIKSDCIPLYVGGGEKIEPKVLNEKAILRWHFNQDNSDTLELFKNLLNDEKTYNEFKEQNVLLDSAYKFAIKKVNQLEKRIENLIYE